MEEAYSGQILLTKLRSPDLPGDFVPREKLLSYVSENIERPLTLVSAGAGFGKSTFVSYWLKNIPYKNCWLSLDESDNDPRTFIRHFMAAINTVVPDFGQKIQVLLQIPTLPGTEVLENHLINDLNDLPERIILALDDFHFIDDQYVLRIISEMVKHPPRNLHLIIISRNDPPLPLMRLRARNKMKEIRSSQLRQNQKEIKQFIQKNIDSEYCDLIADKLATTLEGWAAGLRLALLHLSFHDLRKEKIDDVFSGPGSPENYFLQEVLNQLDDQTLDFFLKTSILQKFTTDLADFLVSSPQNRIDSRQLIDELIRRNLFIINLDHEGQWYRYHHLLQMLLQKELKKKYPEGFVSALHKRAAEWYENNGLTEDAMYHASHSGDMACLATLVGKHMHTPLNENKWYILEKWLNKIPDQYIRESPALLLAQMWVFSHKNMYWTFPDLLSRLEELSEKEPLKEDMLYQIDFFHAELLFWGGKIKESIVMSDQVRKNLSEERIGVVGQAYIYYAVGSQMNGNGQEVAREYINELSRTNLNPTQRVLINAALIYMKFQEGDLYAVERFSRQLRDATTEDDDYVIAWFNYFMGYIALQQNKPERAESFFREALRRLHYLNSTAPLDTFAGMLLSLLQQGKKEEFDRIFDQMITFVRENNNPYNTAFSYSLRSRLALLQNDLPAAVDLIKMTDMSFDTGNMIFNIELPRLTYITVLLAQDTSVKIQEALQKIQAIGHIAEKTRNIPQSIRIRILQAIAYKKSNKLKQARASLQEAVELALPGNWIYPFVEAAAEIRELLDDISDNEKHSEFISTIQEKHSVLKAPSVPPGPPINNGLMSHQLDPLTNRELDILNLLAERLSNKEIAARLYISEATVKRHTITIYQKLDVHKRREAVARAKAMEIL